MNRLRPVLGALSVLGIIWWLAFCVEEQMFSSAYKIATAATGYLALVGLGVFAFCGLPERDK